MRYLSAVILVMIIQIHLFAESGLVRNGSDPGGHEYIFSVTEGGAVFRKKVYLAGAGRMTPERIVYIFHGYKPEGDPYEQSPSYFIRNWNLDERAKKYSVLFVIPDNGDSVYPVTQKDRPGSDMRMLARLEKQISADYRAKAAPVAVGFSAGVEGAVKFSLATNVSEIMAISGNYDLFDLPAGERAFHEKAFGKGLEALRKENPIDLLGGSNKTVYLFCEERNAVNARQAKTLVDASVPGVKVIDLRDVGKGYGHDWKFLTSRGILDAFDVIISGRGSTLRATGGNNLSGSE